MSGREAALLLRRISGTWSNLKLSEQAVEVWMERLYGLDEASASKAYERLLMKGGDFAPSLAAFLAEVAEVEQGPPPSPEEVDSIIRRNASRWPYRGHVSPEEHTAGAIRQLMEVGAHEAVCRFVAQVGGQEAAEMPDVRAGLDTSMSVRRHELLRSYREQAVSAWKADPTPGLALAAAERQLELGAARRTGLRKLAVPQLPEAT